MAAKLRAAGFDFEIAVCDIAAGAELTDDYGTLNLQYDFACICGTPECRKTITPRDLDVDHSAAEGLDGAADLVDRAEQVLFELRMRYVEARKGGSPPPSESRIILP